MSDDPADRSNDGLERLRTERQAPAPTNDTASSFLKQATRYVERGVMKGAESEEHAFWLHFALEPLLRAAVSSVHPVLLADPRVNEALLAAVGVGIGQARATRSRPSSSLVLLLRHIDAERFDIAFERRTNALLDRRNAECHTSIAAMAAPSGGWRDDFLRVAKAICEFLHVELESVLGRDLAALAVTLSARDEQDIRAEVERLIAEARAQAPPARVVRILFPETPLANGAIQRVMACPACENMAYLTGWVIGRGDPKLRGEILVRRLTVASQTLECHACSLRLIGQQPVVAAGLPGGWESIEVVDRLPYEALSLYPAEEVERMRLDLLDPRSPDFDDI